MMLSLDRPTEVTIPLSITLKIIPDLPRPAIEELVTKLIEALDQQDGDSDIEPNGDELDGSSVEEDIPTISGPDWHLHSGCPISDPAEPNGDCEPDNPDGLGEWREDQRIAYHAYGKPWDVDEERTIP